MANPYELIGIQFETVPSLARGEEVEVTVVECPMALIRNGIEVIELAADGGSALARAMMTTDTRPKEVAVTFEVDGHQASIGGVAKVPA